MDKKTKSSLSAAEIKKLEVDKKRNLI